MASTTVVATLSPSSSRRLLSRPARLPSSPSCSSSSTSFSHRSRAAPLPKGRVLASAAALLASGAGLALALAAASANALPSGASAVLQEPENALSLPTWAVHVSSVIEWVAAMALVWEYGEKSGFPSWKGLSWGMVPLLGGALCACTWHFFYNSESLERALIWRLCPIRESDLGDFCGIVFLRSRGFYTPNFSKIGLRIVELPVLQRFSFRPCFSWLDGSR